MIEKTTRSGKLILLYAPVCSRPLNAANGERFASYVERYRSRDRPEGVSSDNDIAVALEGCAKAEVEEEAAPRLYVET